MRALRLHFQKKERTPRHEEALQEPRQDEQINPCWKGETSDESERESEQAQLRADREDRRSDELNKAQKGQERRGESCYGNRSRYPTWNQTD